MGFVGRYVNPWQRARDFVALLLARDGSLCGICSKELGDDIEIDHIKPFAVGGSDNIENLQLAHFKCNKAKGATVTKSAKCTRCGGRLNTLVGVLCRKCRDYARHPWSNYRL